jgi:hypothetical protein
MKNSRGSRSPGGVIWSALVFVVLALFPCVAASEPAEEPEAQFQTHAEKEHNDVGVFLGATAGGEATGGGHEDATATIGIEYRRNLSSIVGVGLLLEFSGGERRSHVGIVPVTLMLGSRVQLIVGVGWERHTGTEFLGRLGFGYKIMLVPGNSIRPEINIDFVDGETLVVVGASIGWDF